MKVTFSADVQVEGVSMKSGLEGRNNSRFIRCLSRSPSSQ